MFHVDGTLDMSRKNNLWRKLLCYFEKAQKARDSWGWW